MGALHALRSEKQLEAKTFQETHFLSNEETPKWFKDCVETEITEARSEFRNVRQRFSKSRSTSGKQNTQD
jgi:hypothetical protein